MDDGAAFFPPAICAGKPRITVLHGENFIPWDHAMFHDGLHPNDLGMTLYAEQVAEKSKSTAKTLPYDVH